MAGEDDRARCAGDGQRHDRRPGRPWKIPPARDRNATRAQGADMNPTLDLIVKNVRVVRPNKTAVDLLDIGIKDGKFARLAPEIAAGEGKTVIDGNNLLGFPGCVDAHMHVGIYQPLAQDAVSESKAAAMGGVTSSLNYVRT